ncbi:hypothetical protein SAMN04489712_105243 [Thermomonospora echinospora]|uniref:Uncharacterized protein n=1 Tax=Thermomonospora echinospora TaxID=1992 RepID=A0A1H6A6C2_9ACTN|nr:hypothetical protein [Thermomonospora echinospora]SEG44279.1 hypothetical protein SAMN04489712_105243 [Thermomonospora echinospora]
MTTILILLAVWTAVALLIAPPIGRMLRRAADAEILAPLDSEDDGPTLAMTAVGDCPDWCPGQHTPGAHRRTVDVREKTGDPGGVWVELAWYTVPGRPPVGQPEVTLVSIVGTDETLMPMSPGEAGMLAASIAFPDADSTLAAWGRALSGDAGWLAETLARAAVMAGYSPCGGCGTPTDARPEYDQASGELVARCAGCHREALTGGEVR